MKVFLFMPFKKLHIIFLLSLSFFFIIPFTSFSETKAEKSAKFWEKVFLEKIDNFEYYSKEVDYLVYQIQKDLTKFRSNASQFNTRYHQLKIIMGSIINNPYELRFVIAELNSSENSFFSLYTGIQSLHHQAKKYIEALNDIENDLKFLSKTEFTNTNMIAASIRLLFNVKILKAHLLLERENMTKTLDDMKELIDKYTIMSDLLKELFIKQLSSYFLVPGPPLWSLELTRVVPYSFAFWLRTLPAVFKERFPNDVDEYIAVLIIFGIALIIYLIFHYLLIKKINIKAKIPNAYEIFLRALAALILFLGLFATASVLIFPQTVLFYRLGVVVFGFFAWIFSLALKVIQCPDTRHDSTMLSLFVIFLCGILLQLFSMPYIMLILIWPLILLSTIIYLIVINYKNKTISKLSHVWIFILFTSVFIILSLSGYIYLSVFCCMVWFLIHVAIRLGTVLTWMLKVALDKEKFYKRFYRVILVGFGIPFIWLTLFLIVFFWASIQISHNSYTTLEYLAGITLKLPGYDIKIIDIFILVFLFAIFRGTIKAITEFLSYTSYAKQNQRHQVLPAMKTLTAYVGWVIYFIILMLLFRINITSILVILGGLSVGIGFGLQHLFYNFVAGLIILFGKCCRPGDIVELNGLWATVLRTDIRTTTIKTFENCIVTLPNAMVIDEKLHNWTKENDLIRNDLEVGVAYGSDIDLVKKVLLEIASSVKEVCHIPQPQVIFKSFGDSSLVFTLRIWLYKIDDIIATPSEIRYQINQEFNKNNIVIAYRQLDVHIKDTPNNILKETK